LADLHLDPQTIMAALLHDVIEDTPRAKDEIAEHFGDEVATLVDGVSKLDQLQFRSKEEAQAESFRKMILAMTGDIRVIMVKLADRTHNMRTLGVLPTAKRRRIARETLDIYAPISNRLGMNNVRLELEDLGFRSLYPFRYKVIERALKKSTGNQKQLVKKITKVFEEALSKLSIPATVHGREKHIYSVYKKMLKKGSSLGEIADVYGFRIVVDDVDTCYRALGLVHKLYKPMPGRFKDYIAIPRVNGYQSLHTTLFGPNGIPIEAQIRTIEMDQVAESGIAAHWQYKSGDESTAPQARAREWLTGLMELEAGSSSEELLETVKVDLFPDKVYVFTPRGDILRLPRGATAVDFGYAVHTDIGNRTVAAKINRRLVPLRTPLQNGQTVEVITAKGAHPNPAWVNFVATAKARNAIRQYLKNLRRGEAADLGKRLLKQALSEFKTTIRKTPKERLDGLLSDFGIDTLDALYQKIGLGERLAPLVARRLVSEDSEPKSDGPAPLAITGTEGMVVTYAKCCYPIPDDPIIGYLSSGRGIVIHRNSCGNLAEYRKQPDKWLPVAWKGEVDREFLVEIRAEVVNRMGVLAAVASTIATTKSNIDHVSVVERDGDTSTLIFQIFVNDRKQLARVMRSIRAMPDVLHVSRSCA
jgi:RelA/SpoT family (p)ppGpp synthetase